MPAHLQQSYSHPPLSSISHLTAGTPLPLHIPLPRLRPHHKPNALKRAIENPLVELPRHLDPLERITSATHDAFSTDFILAHVDNMLAAFIGAALPAHGAHGVGVGGEVARVGIIVDVGRAVGRVVPGGDFGRSRDGRSDAGGAARGFSGGDEGGGGAEDEVELVVDV